MNNMLGLTQVQKEFCNIAFPLCICRLTLAWISSEISTKLLGMPTHLDRSSFTALDPISCQLVSLLSGFDWPLASPFADCLLLSPFSHSLTRILFLLPVTLRSWAQAFVWFHAKTDKGITCLADHLHSVTGTPPPEKNVLDMTLNCIWGMWSTLFIAMCTKRS